jgi:leucyl aminopeptidase (aminopeptidase T)
MDKRWSQLSDLLVNYSLAVKPGEKVMIAFGELETSPLVYALYQSCIMPAYRRCSFSRRIEPVL